MPYPAGTYVVQIPDYYTRQELDQFYSLLQGWLSTDHLSDGTHGNIRAQSVDIRANTSTGATGNLTADGTGAFDGTVTADADGTPVAIGADATFGPGIEMVNGTVSKWRISASTSGGVPMLLIRDELLTNETGSLDFIRTTGGGTPVFELRPHNAAHSVLIGTNASGQRMSEVNGLIVRANTAYYERSRSAAVGEWTTPAYAGTDFTASSGTWGVDSADITTYAYTIVGKTITVAFEIASTDVSATPAELRIKIPGGFTAAKQMRNPVVVVDAGGAPVVSFAQVQATGTVIRIFPTINGGNWTLTAGDNTAVLGQITFEIQ